MWAIAADLYILSNNMKPPVLRKLEQWNYAVISVCHIYEIHCNNIIAVVLKLFIMLLHTTIKICFQKTR